MYEVRYFMKGYENNASSMLINRPESAFSSLRQQTVYGFQVRAKTTHGWGEFSSPVFKTTGTVLGIHTHTPITSTYSPTHLFTGLFTCYLSSEMDSQLGIATW